MLKKLLAKARPAIPANNRVYAVGDVHGRLDLLEKLLGTIEKDNDVREPAEVTLIFLGDLIDRGDNSRGVVARVREGVDWARVIPLMGNHEAIMLGALEGDKDKLHAWIQFGGHESLISWGVSRHLLDTGSLDEILAAARTLISGEELGWISRMRSAVRIGDYYFVHAGVRPGISLDRQMDEDRLWIREAFLESRKNHGAIVVHGHSIRASVDHRPNRIGLDTGAYASDRLTALGLQNMDQWFLDTAS